MGFLLVDINFNQSTNTWATMNSTLYWWSFHEWQCLSQATMRTTKFPGCENWLFVFYSSESFVFLNLPLLTFLPSLVPLALRVKDQNNDLKQYSNYLASTNCLLQGLTTKLLLQKCIYRRQRSIIAPSRLPITCPCNVEHLNKNANILTLNEFLMIQIFLKRAFIMMSSTWH